MALVRQMSRLSQILSVTGTQPEWAEISRKLNFWLIGFEPWQRVRIRMALDLYRDTDFPDDLGSPFAT